MTERFQQQIATNTSISNVPIIIVDFYSGYLPPYQEQKLVDYYRRFKPVAIVIMGAAEYHERAFSEVGRAFVNRMSISTAEVTCPVVQTYWSTWYQLRSQLLNGSEPLWVTIDDQPDNAWWTLVTNAWLPIWMTISIVWSLINIGLSSWALARIKHLTRTLVVVVLFLEIASNILRLPFFLDPFAGWWLPSPVINVFFTMSWPLHIASGILVIFFWLELATTSNIKTRAGFITARKWPAAVTICIVALAEYGTAAARASGSTPLIILIAAVIYLLILLFCVLTYVYVYVQVRKFFSALPTLSGNQQLVNKVSLRLLLTAMSFIVLIILGCLLASNVYNTALGQSLIQFFIFITLNAGSTFTIWAFIESQNKSLSKSGNQRSGERKTASGQSAQRNTSATREMHSVV